jgi:CubicO group peptidase (beta-lactamase class C family)
MPSGDRITATMKSAVQSGVFPGAVLFVRASGRVVYHRAVGSAALVPEREPASVETIYDLASLTKPLATTSAVLCLMQQGRLSIEAKLKDLLDEVKGTPLGEATLWHLLNHSSGLPPWRPFHERLAEQQRAQPGSLGGERAARLMLDLIRAEPLLYPAGSRSMYSDLGFMLLGFIVERVGGEPLDVFCRARVHEPLGATPLFYLRTGSDPSDLPVELRRIAPTERDDWRGRILRGVVHDENAYALGGVAGHSGLFGTAKAVAAVSGAWLAGALGRNGGFDLTLVRRFVTRQSTPDSSWGLGWDTPSAPSSSGARFSTSSFGHLGYTGTSLWVDPTRELEVILLSNRVHPTRRNDAIRQFRPLIHDVIFEELVGK